MGAKGKWIRGDVSWSTLSYLNYRRECNEAHVEWMQEFLASHTAVANRQHSGTGLWLGLNTYAGKNLWSLLAQAKKIGVALVHAAASEPVRLVEQPAAVGLNLARFGSGRATTAACELAPTITVEGEVVDPASVGTIGRPAHGIFLASDGDALPGVAPHRPRHHPCPAGKRSQRGIADLRHGRRPPCTSRPGREPVPDRLLPQAQADRPGARPRMSRWSCPRWPSPPCPCWPTTAADHRVRLHWEWHYTSGNLVTAQPLWRHPGDHGYRDDPAEARILEASRAALGRGAGAGRIRHRRLGHTAPCGHGRTGRPGHARLHRGRASPAPRPPRRRGGHLRRDRGLPRSRRSPGGVDLHEGDGQPATGSTSAS